MIQVALKNPGEKLVRIDVEFEENTITYIHISGDFFIYPEEAIGKIEKELIGLPVDEKQIQETINKLAKTETIELVGISSETIAQGILEAFSKQ